MTEQETITSGPLAGCMVSPITLADVFNPTERYLLALNDRGELGYLAAQQEWVDDHGDPLQEAEQWAADELARGGFLPQFAEWFPAVSKEGGTVGEAAELPSLQQPWAMEIAPGVWAVQLTDEANGGDWDPIADWAGGELVTGRDVSDEYGAYIVIPRPGGAYQEAYEGWWVIRNTAGGRHVASPDAFTLPSCSADEGNTHDGR